MNDNLMIELIKQIEQLNKNLEDHNSIAREHNEIMREDIQIINGVDLDELVDEKGMAH